MSHGEALGSGGRRDSGGRRGYGGRRGSRGSSSPSGQWVPKLKNPVTVDRSSDESCGSRDRGFRGRGRGSTSCSPRNTSGYANAEHTPVQACVPKNSSQVSTVEKIVPQGTKSEEDQIVSAQISGDNQDLWQSSVSPSSKNITNHCESSSVSVSSTIGDQRVELSRLVDHDHTQKSGDARSSSTESKRRPFDLFLVKNVMGLKPSLLELNQERKKATKRYTGIVIRPGMVLLKNYLSISDQVMIVNKCRQLGLDEGGFYQPGYRDGALLHLKMMCLGKNWDPETSRYGETRPADGSFPPKIPFEFSQFVETAIKESQSLAAESHDVIPNMLPDICIVNFYESTGRLGLHQDKDESKTSIKKGLPVVSFSIGDSAEFLYGDERDEYKAEKLLLESGDVLLFGGKSRSVFHGVRSILKNTAPKGLSQETNLRPGRLNLTFRQY